MAFCFLSQLNQNAVYEVEDEDRSSPEDEEEGENEESDIELDPEDARARGNGNRANANLDLDLDSDTEEDASAEFAWSSELHDIEIEMFTQYTGPLFLLNMSDSMQTKYNTQKSTRKPKNDKKTCIMPTKIVFLLEIMTFF